MGNCTKPSSDTSSQNHLIVKSYTWQRDSHGLFDYELYLLREKNNIKTFAPNQINNESLPNSDRLAEIQYNLGSFMIKTQIQKQNLEESPQIIDEGVGDNCIWGVVKSLKSNNGVNGYEINQGDYLKFGRVRYRIKDINLSTEENAQKDGFLVNNENIQLNRSFQLVKIDSDEENSVVQTTQAAQNNTNNKESKNANAKQCRICLSEAFTQDNPLISPCKCDGTMKYIHISCLQKWLKQQLHAKQTSVSITFQLKTFYCELCQTPFPNQILHNNRVYDTVEIQKPKPPYFTMEILSRERNLCKGYHIVTLSNKNQIKLGRGHDADIRITDISVSRLHAIIKYEKGKIYVEDQHSKFGTLVLLQKPLKISKDMNNFAIQVGRTVISFQQKSSWKITSSCFKNQSIQQEQETNLQNNQQPMAQQKYIQQEQLGQQQQQQPQQQQQQHQQQQQPQYMEQIVNDQEDDDNIIIQRNLEVIQEQFQEFPENQQASGSDSPHINDIHNSQHDNNINSRNSNTINNSDNNNNNNIVNNNVVDINSNSNNINNLQRGIEDLKIFNQQQNMNQPENRSAANDNNPLNEKQTTSKNSQKLIQFDNSEEQKIQRQSCLQFQQQNVQCQSQQVQYNCNIQNTNDVQLEIAQQNKINRIQSQNNLVQNQNRLNELQNQKSLSNDQLMFSLTQQSQDILQKNTQTKLTQQQILHLQSQKFQQSDNHNQIQEISQLK